MNANVFLIDTIAKKSEPPMTLGRFKMAEATNIVVFYLYLISIWLINDGANYYNINSAN